MQVTTKNDAQLFSGVMHFSILMKFHDFSMIFLKKIKFHDFSMIFSIFFKFHDFSIPGIFIGHFPGFPGFPVPVATMFMLKFPISIIWRNHPHITSK